MPFQRYLDGDPSPDAALDLGVDANTFSANVHFHLPNHILGAPILAPGGGAEVLPSGCISTQNPFAQSWYTPTSYARYSDHSPLPKPMHRTQPPHHQLLPETPFAQQHAYHPPPSSLPTNSLPPSTTPYALPLSNPFPNHSQTPSRAASPSPLMPAPMSMSFPSPAGLPVYSTSGFDLLSILSRIANRPRPNIALGPVDMTCAFVVVDVRRFDAPIVYASPTFCSLTGYPEHEVLGRNCRFLQAPDGRVQRGDVRRFTAPDAVAHLRRCTSQGKECQTSMINYRKGGAAFINLVTVIPVPPDSDHDSVAYHVGFQVDLAQQPGAILQKLRDGSYIVDYSRRSMLSAAGPRNWRATAAAMHGVSNELHTLLADPAFLASAPLALPSPVAPAAPGDKADPYDGNKPLHLLLLACAPDFVTVVSLKGAFLYVAPAVRRVLGYAPDELVGRSLTDLCHAADVVPLMRELKESSVLPAPVPQPTDDASAPAHEPGPRRVDLLFRMPNKAGATVWVECRGRLHVEPGKGRKAIILSARVRAMPCLAWASVAPAPEREFWALLGARGTVLFAGAAVRDVLGWGAGEVIGRPVADYVAGGAGDADVRAVLGAPGAEAGARSVLCEMHRKDGACVRVRVVLHRAQTDADADARGPVVCQVRVCDGGAGEDAGAREGAHAPGESVFAELATARGSSWQYELQQLKYTNRRLAEEVAALEAEVDAKGGPLQEQHAQERHPQHAQAYAAHPPPRPSQQQQHAHSERQLPPPQQQQQQQPYLPPPAQPPYQQAFQPRQYPLPLAHHAVSYTPDLPDLPYPSSHSRAQQPRVDMLPQPEWRAHAGLYPGVPATHPGSLPMKRPWDEMSGVDPT